MPKPPTKSRKVNRPIREGSLTDVLLALNPGDTHAICKQLNAAPADNTPEVLSAAKRAMATTAGKAAKRLLERTGADLEFEIETTVASTTRNRVFLLCLVTRTK